MTMERDTSDLNKTRSRSTTITTTTSTTTTSRCRWNDRCGEFVMRQKTVDDDDEQEKTET